VSVWSCRQRHSMGMAVQAGMQLLAAAACLNELVWCGKRCSDGIDSCSLLTPAPTSPQEVCLSLPCSALLCACCCCWLGLQLERKRAAAMGYESPIWDTIDGTHTNYSKCLEAVLDEVRGHTHALHLAVTLPVTGHGRRESTSPSSRVEAPHLFRR
jgi:hypothetical protein